MKSFDWLFIAFTFLHALCEVWGQSVASSFSLEVLKSCRSADRCTAGSPSTVHVGVTTGQFGSSPCAPQLALGVCPGQPLFDIGSFINYTLTLLDFKSNAPINYTITVPMKCTGGKISGTFNTQISGYYRVKAVAFYNGLNPPQPGPIENLDCTNQPRENDPMIVLIIPAEFVNVSRTFVNEAKLKTRNNYLSPCRVIVQMSDSFGNPKDDCSATFSGTSISGNVSTVSAVGCDPLGRTDAGDSVNTLDGESGPVLKHCQSIQLNNQFTEADIRQDGVTILKKQLCDAGGHEFLFSVSRSGTYVFISTMSFGGASQDLKLIVNVDSGIPSRVRSFVFGDNVKQVVATSVGNIVIQAVDKLQFPRTSGTLDLSISISSVFVSGQDLPVLELGKNIFWELFNGNNGMYMLYFRVNVACTISISVLVQDPQIEGQPLSAVRTLLKPQIAIIPVTFAYDGGNVLDGFQGNLAAAKVQNPPVPSFFFMQMNTNGCKEDYKYAPRIFFDGPAPQYGEVSSCWKGVFPIIKVVFTVSGVYSVKASSNELSIKIEALAMTVSPSEIVASKFSVIGSVFNVPQANRETSILVQSRDIFGNLVNDCTSSIFASIEPQNQGLDSLIPANDFNLAYLKQQSIPTVSFNFTKCVNGEYRNDFFVRLSSNYLISVLINGTLATGMPVKKAFIGEIQDVVMDFSLADSFTSYGRWKYFVITLPKNGIGFQARATRIEDPTSIGQPWIFAEFDTVTLKPDPDIVTFGTRTAFSGRDCVACRVHVPPSFSQAGKWYIGVYAAHGNVRFRVDIEQYSMSTLTVLQPSTYVLKPGLFAYFMFNITSTAGFQVQVKAVGIGGLITASVKRGGMPSNIYDVSSVNAKAMIAQDVKTASIAQPADPSIADTWYIAVMASVASVQITVSLNIFKENVFILGDQASYARSTVDAGSVVYFKFMVDVNSKVDGLEIAVIPEELKSDILSAVKLGSFPSTSDDTSFPIKPCTHCRLSVMTKINIKTSWTIGIFGNTVGGTFVLRARATSSCPNQCTGNGNCIQKKLKVCICFPGYKGIDCSKPIKEKVLVWFPFTKDILDISGNNELAFLKMNKGSGISFTEDRGLSIVDAFIITSIPQSQIFCHPGHRTDENSQANSSAPAGEKNFQTSGACQQYDVLQEMTVIFTTKFARFPGTGSFIGVGKESKIAGRADADNQGMWSWLLYPMQHTDAISTIVDLMFRNETHEHSIQESVALPIGNAGAETPLLQKIAPKQQRFPDYNPLLKLDTSYHIAIVFKPFRAQLFVNGELQKEMIIPKMKLKDILVDGWLHLGHDCRFAEFERLFFGSFKDLRILAYAASPFEIATHYKDGLLWFAAKANYLTSLSVEKGSAENPSPLAFQNMGSLPVTASPHEEACANYRVANENDTLVSSMSCPFEGGQVSWLNYNSVNYNYRKYTNERIMYGLGMIITINQENRVFTKPITDSFNDYSIKEDL